MKKFFCDIDGHSEKKKINSSPEIDNLAGLKNLEVDE